MVIAATTANTAMQIPITTQKTKSIRSPSFDRTGGSHGTKIATAVAAAAASRAITTSRRIAPLRTEREPTERTGVLPS